MRTSPPATAPRFPSPFREALGPAFASLHPAMRLLHRDAPAVRRFRGVMARVWGPRRGLRGRIASLVLRLCARLDTLFPETGERAPFDLLYRLAPPSEGRPRLEALRAFHFPRQKRRFDATYRSLEGRGRLDWISGRGRIGCELVLRVERGALCIRSRRMRVRLCGLWFRLPGPLSAEARVRAFAAPGGGIGIRLAVHNPILGEFFGYEGSFAEVGKPGRTC